MAEHAVPSLPDFSDVPAGERAALVETWHAAAAAVRAPVPSPARQSAVWARLSQTLSCLDLAEAPALEHDALVRLWSLSASAQPAAPALVPDRKAAVWARIQSTTAAPNVSDVPADEQAALLEVWHAARFAQPAAPALRVDRRASTWARVRARLQPHPAVAGRADRPARARMASIRRLAPFVLPAVLLLLGSGGYWGFAPHSLTAPAGGQQTFTLADGSTVTLSGGTTLTNTRWNPRAVRLEGVAFFDVAHDPGAPFTVEAPGANVRVLGTAFEVRATGLPGTTSEVTVARGLVAVSSPEAPETRVPAGQRLRLDAGAQSRPAPFTGEVADWRSGAFRFSNTPLADILADAATRFGTHIEVPATLGTRRWTVALTRPTQVEDVLRAVTEPLGLQFRPVAGGYEVLAP